MTWYFLYFYSGVKSLCPLKSLNYPNTIWLIGPPIHNSKYHKEQIPNTIDPWSLYSSLFKDKKGFSCCKSTFPWLWLFVPLGWHFGWSKLKKVQKFQLELVWGPQLFYLLLQLASVEKENLRLVQIIWTCWLIAARNK